MRDDFKAAMRQWRTGICLVTTTGADGTPAGLICNSFTSVSLEPLLISWAVDHASSSLVTWQSASSYALHILPPLEDPFTHPLVRNFAQRGGNKFLGLDYERNAQGDPIFPELPTRFDCALVQRISVGDHDLMIGQPSSITHPLQNRAS